MAAVLVTLQQAKDHLRITTPALDPADVDLQQKLDTAEGIILDYLATAGDPAWTTATAPPPVQAAILLMLGHLRENRGDADMKSDTALWEAIGRILTRLRNPALA